MKVICGEFYRYGRFSEQEHQGSRYNVSHLDARSGCGAPKWPFDTLNRTSSDDT